MHCNEDQGEQQQNECECVNGEVSDQKLTRLGEVDKETCLQQPRWQRGHQQPGVSRVNNLALLVFVRSCVCQFT